MSKILVVAAHPDDDILGCGGLMDKLSKEKKSVRVIFIAEGSSSRYSHIKDNKKIKEEILIRTKNAIDALSLLKIKKYKFYDLEDGKLDIYPSLEINRIIEKEITTFKPDTILTHYKDDCNSDHRIVYNSVITATRPKPNQIVKNILSFEVLSSTEWNFDVTFSANYFVDIKKNIKNKINAFNKYIKTEGGKFPFPRSGEGIMTLSKYRGMQVGLKNAEAYRIIRLISN